MEEEDKGLMNEGKQNVLLTGQTHRKGYSTLYMGLHKKRTQMFSVRCHFK